MISVALVFLLLVMEVYGPIPPSFFSFHVHYWRFARLNNGKLASQGGVWLVTMGYLCELHMIYVVPSSISLSILYVVIVF